MRLLCLFFLASALHSPAGNAKGGPTEQPTVDAVTIDFTWPYYPQQSGSIGRTLPPLHPDGFAFSNDTSTDSWAGTAGSYLFRPINIQVEEGALTADLEPTFSAKYFALVIEAVGFEDEQPYDIRLGFHLIELSFSGVLGSTYGSIEGTLRLTRDDETSPHLRPLRHANVPVGSLVGVEVQMILPDGMVITPSLFDTQFQPRYLGAVDTSVAIPEPSTLLLALLGAGWILYLRN